MVVMSAYLRSLNLGFRLYSNDYELEANLVTERPESYLFDIIFSPRWKWIAILPLRSSSLNYILVLIFL